MVRLIKRCILILLVCSLLLTGGCHSSENSINIELPLGSSFWEMLNISPQEITTIYMVYKNQKVPLTQIDAQKIIRILTAADLSEVADNHEYTPCPYSFIFQTEQVEIPVIFYWFTYLAISDTKTFDVRTHGSYRSPDNRFDVKFKNSIFHFRFNGNEFWNESYSKNLYDKSAGLCGMAVSYKLDGYQMEMPAYGNYDGLNNLNDILESADAVVLGHVDQYETFAREEQAAWFCVEDTIKGDTPELIPVRQFPETWKNSYIIYPWPMLDGLNMNQTYLLCLSFHPSTFYQYRSIYRWYRDLKGTQYYDSWQRPPIKEITIEYWENISIYSTAVLESSVLYQSFNTEYHPFYGISLDTVNAKCADLQ